MFGIPLGLATLVMEDGFPHGRTDSVDSWRRSVPSRLEREDPFEGENHEEQQGISHVSFRPGLRPAPITSKLTCDSPPGGRPKRVAQRLSPAAPVDAAELLPRRYATIWAGLVVVQTTGDVLQLPPR
jgi:hypothetical protein